MKQKKAELPGGRKRKRISPEISSMIHPTRQAIIDALEEHGLLTTIELERILKESRYNLYHHLNTLKEQRLIKEKLEGKVKLYELAKKTPVISISTMELAPEKKEEAIEKINELIELFHRKPITGGKEYRCIIVEEAEED